MTEQNPGPVPPASPEQESALRHVEDWFHARRRQVDPAVISVAEELKPLLSGHAAGVFALAAKVLASPELRALAPQAVDLADSAVTIASAAL